MASVAKRYSDALFLAAESENAVDAVAADMAFLGIALDERELRHFLADPNSSVADKKGLLVRLLESEHGDTGKREVNACTLRFLDVVFKKRRALELHRVTELFHTRVLESRGEVEGRVQSFSELSGDELQQLEESLGARVGRKVRLIPEIDEEILGGVRVFLGDRLFDASLQGQLIELGRKLRGAPLPSQAD